MQKIILQFETLGELAAFAKTLPKGYLIDTNRITLTTTLPLSQITSIRTASNIVKVDFTPGGGINPLWN